MDIMLINAGLGAIAGGVTCVLGYLKNLRKDEETKFRWDLFAYNLGIAVTAGFLTGMLLVDMTAPAFVGIVMAENATFQQIIKIAKPTA